MKHELFHHYQEIRAKYPDKARCGHPVAPGDAIGWNRRTRAILCEDCWRKWAAENAEAQAIEAGYRPNVW